MTLVEQHSVLFRGTLRDNIVMGERNGTVTDHDIAEAVKFARLKQMVAALPKGLDSIVGVKGSTLRGGQRQQVALARARLRDTLILVLDESTSALDHVTRTEIFRNIRAWGKGETTIVITHDVPQILPEDYVYVLDGGCVVQEGYRKSMEDD